MMDDPVIGIDGELVGMDEGNKDGWSLRAMDKKMEWVVLSKPIVELEVLDWGWFLLLSSFSDCPVLLIGESSGEVLDPISSLWVSCV